MTHREKILSTLRHATTPLDDDEISRRTGIRPRQQVNQICRALTREGLVTRTYGPDRKIVNSVQVAGQVPPASDEASSGATEPKAPADPVVPPGDSSEQRQAERSMLDALGERLGLVLSPRRLERP